MSNQNIGTCGFALFCIIVFIFVAPFLFFSSGLVFVNVSFSSGYLLTFFTHDTRVIWYLWLKIYFMSNIPNIPQGGLPLPFHWLLYTSHEERTQGGRQTVRWEEKCCFSSYTLISSHQGNIDVNDQGHLAKQTFQKLRKTILKIPNHNKRKTRGTWPTSNTQESLGAPGVPRSHPTSPQ